MVKVEMLLDRDQFVVTFRQSLAKVADLISIVKKSGFEAQVVSEPVPEARKENDPQPEFPHFFVEALARAGQEQKPIVLDFSADWCLPCQRMEKETFSDPEVAALLKRCIVLRVDPDEHPSLAQQFRVVGLPDIRLLDGSGKQRKQLLDFHEARLFQSELEELLEEAGNGSERSN